MAELESLGERARDDVQTFLTFRTAGRLYALPSADVREVIIPPSLARVPLSPKPLLGLGNLRGSVLPVASLRLLLNLPREAAHASERVVVLEDRPAFGLLVDDVEALQTIDEADVATSQAELSADGLEMLRGAFSVSGSGEIAKILDIRPLLVKALGATARPATNGALPTQRRERSIPSVEASLETFITFEVSGQEFGLPLAAVLEVLPTAEVAAAMPRAEAVVLGMTALRTLLLPLLSLRGLLGLPAPIGSAGKGMTVVVTVGGAVVGLAVDGVRDIVRVARSELEPVPAVIASRSQGEASVQSVLKTENGKRLIAILSPDKLFREDIMNRIKGSAPSRQAPAPASAANGEERIFLVFRLGEQEFGLAIGAVEEVARLPSEVTRLPKSPDFLKGVINLRGTVLPVIDQRKRFDLPELSDREGQRLVVVRIGAHTAGFIVDGVSEVLRVRSSEIEPPPDVVEQSRVLEGVINLETTDRMILLLDPSQLLNRTEQGLLDALGRVQEAQSAIDQDSNR